MVDFVRQVVALTVVGGLFTLGTSALTTRFPALVLKVVVILVALPPVGLQVAVVATGPVKASG